MKLNFGLCFMLCLNMQQVQAKSSPLWGAEHVTPPYNQESIAQAAQTNTLEATATLNPPSQQQRLQSLVTSRTNQQHLVISPSDKAPVSPWTLPTVIAVLLLLLWMISRSRRHG